MFLGIGVAGVGFEHLISVQNGEEFTGVEVRVVCSAVAMLMASLIGIASTSDTPRKDGTRRKRLSAQLGLTGAIIVLAILAPALNRVFLATGLVAICCGQTLLGRDSGLGPRLIALKAS
jgi:hypothetical protein